MARGRLIVFEGVKPLAVSRSGADIVPAEAISKPIIGGYLLKISKSIESLVHSVRRILSRRISRLPRGVVLFRNEQVTFRPLTCRFPRDRAGEGREQVRPSRNVFGDVDSAFPAVDVVAIDRLSKPAADSEHIDKPADRSEGRDRLNPEPVGCKLCRLPILTERKTRPRSSFE